eukprot:scaffold5024_cov136-Cylindrotheca_fusiformis.AAC.2
MDMASHYTEFGAVRGASKLCDQTNVIGGGKYLPQLRTDWTVMSAGLCFCNSGAVQYAHLGPCLMREAWCLPLLSNMMTNPGYLSPKSLNNRACLYPVGA